MWIRHARMRILNRFSMFVSAGNVSVASERIFYKKPLILSKPIKRTMSRYVIPCLLRNILWKKIFTDHQNGRREQETLSGAHGSYCYLLTSSNVSLRCFFRGFREMTEELTKFNEFILPSAGSLCSSHGKREL